MSPLYSPDATRNQLVGRIYELFEQVGEPALQIAFDERGHSSFPTPALEKLIADLESNLPEPPQRPKPKTNGTAKPNGKDHRAIKTGMGYYIRRMPLDAVVDKRLTDGDFRMLAILISHCGQDKDGNWKDYCWPSQERMTAELPGCGAKRHVSLSVVNRRIAKLAAIRDDRDEPKYVEIIEPHELRAHGYGHTTDNNTYRLPFLSADTSNMTRQK